MQYRPIELAALEIPVTALYGANDIVEGADMEKWRRLTTAAFCCHRFDGGHFYLFQRAPVLSDIILSGLVMLNA
jgi:surfactin synthase thioesterase subunit